MSMETGSCLNCGGYCSLQLCSPDCAAAWNRKKGRPDRCHGCGTTEGVSSVFIQCAECMAKDGQTHDGYDAQGRYIATSDHYKK